MSIYTTETIKTMKANAERVARKTWQGEVAGPRNFVKPGIYSAEDLKRSWRKTMWDDVPSLMAGERYSRVSK
jgi:hypothetical protein